MFIFLGFFYVCRNADGSVFDQPLGSVIGFAEMANINGLGIVSSQGNLCIDLTKLNKDKVHAICDKLEDRCYVKH